MLSRNGRIYDGNRIRRLTPEGRLALRQRDGVLFKGAGQSQKSGSQSGISLSALNFYHRLAGNAFYAARLNIRRVSRTIRFDSSRPKWRGPVLTTGSANSLQNKQLKEIAATGTAVLKLVSEMQRRRLRSSAQSDGGSAFDQFQPNSLGSGVRGTPSSNS